MKAGSQLSKKIWVIVILRPYILSEVRSEITANEVGRSAPEANPAMIVPSSRIVKFGAKAIISAPIATNKMSRLKTRTRPKRFDSHPPVTDPKATIKVSRVDIKPVTNGVKCINLVQIGNATPKLTNKLESR